MTIPSKLFHYSKNEISELRQDFHDNHRQIIPIFSKPYGLWFSVEDFEDDENWFTWSTKEGFRLDHLKYKYSVNIKNKEKILFILTIEQLKEFSLKYDISHSNIPESKYFKKNQGNKISTFTYLIDWVEVKKNYDGIIIAPYKRPCYFEETSTFWYDGWDCSSGCIWNMENVEISLHSILEEIPESQAEENVKDSHTESLAHLL